MEARTLGWSRHFSFLLSVLGMASLVAGAPACSEGQSADGASAGTGAATAIGGNASSHAGAAGAAGIPQGGGGSGLGGTQGHAGVSGASGAVSSGGMSAAGAGGATGGGTLAGGNAGEPTSGASSGGTPNSGGRAGGAGSAGSAGQGGALSGAGGAAGLAGAGGAAGGSGGGVDTHAMVEAMGFGTNIGNTLENTVTWETGWGQPLITQAYIAGMKSHGIKTVRVPVAWDTYAQNGTIDAAKMGRVKEVVGWITAAGMYAIVNIHWDNGWIDNENGNPPYHLTDAIKTKFASYWKQIGTAFKDVGNQLILEGMNEEGRWTTDGMPYGTPDMPPLNEMNQLFVDTVRAQGGANAGRALLISGFNTDIDRTCVAEFQIPNDPAGSGKLFLSLHYYTPYQFTILEDSSAFTTWGTQADKDQLSALFGKLESFSKERNIPVILGEFAVTKLRQSSYRVAWMTAVAQEALARGVVPVLWDTGADISRSDGALSSDLQSVFSAIHYPN